jgi:hypothetical protein
MTAARKRLSETYVITKGGITSVTVLKLCKQRQAFSPIYIRLSNGPNPQLRTQTYSVSEIYVLLYSLKSIQLSVYR